MILECESRDKLRKSLIEIKSEQLYILIKKSSVSVSGHFRDRHGDLLLVNDQHVSCNNKRSVRKILHNNIHQNFARKFTIS